MRTHHDVTLSPSLKRELAQRRRSKVIRSINNSMPTITICIWVVVLGYMMITRF